MGLYWFNGGFSIKASSDTGKLDWRSSLTVHITDGCRINELISSNNATDINNFVCKRMVLYHHTSIESYIRLDCIVSKSESCAVEAKV